MKSDIKVNRDQMIDRFISMGYETNVSISLVDNMLHYNSLMTDLFSNHDQLFPESEDK